MSVSANDALEQHPGPTQQALANHPKKKGGFVITSVKDNVDGDESADDLDESHTSYSDMSYSRTTDADHDPESSASEDTLNMTLESTLTSTGGQPGYIMAPGMHDKTNIQLSGLQATAILHDIEAKKLKPGGVLLNPSKENNLEKITENATSSQVILPSTSNATQSSVKNLNEKAISNSQTPQSSASAQTLKQTAQAKVPVTNKVVTTTSNVPISSVVTTTASKPATVTGGPTKGGASRVYKVVKREALLPSKRLKQRWGLYDYADNQTPHLDFIVQSISDSRLNFQDPNHHHSHHHAPTLPLSMSATSVPSSSSAYNLHHSDSNSSVYRDPNNMPISMQPGMVGMPVGLATNQMQVQHSTSASSVTHELDNRLLQNMGAPYSFNENLEDLNRRKSIEDRLQDAEHDSIKNAIQSYADLTTQGADNTSEDERCHPSFNHLSLTLLASSRTVRIDNKIEAAMDLVKKHLMLAVRDEVDELKEQIVELKMENDTLKGVLTHEQIHQVQHNLIRQPTGVGSVLGYPIQALPEGNNPQIYHQVLGPKQSLPMPNMPTTQVVPQNFSKPSNMVNPPQTYIQPTQTKPTNLGIIKPVNPQTIHVQSPTQQNLTMVPQQQQQQIIQQQQLHGQSTIPMQGKVANFQTNQQANFQPNQQIYHPNIQTQQQQFTPQQIHGLRQQQAFQHQTGLPQNPGTIPQGFQQPQASNFNPVGFQPQQLTVQPTSDPMTQSQLVFQSQQQATRQQPQQLSHPAANITSPTSSNPTGHQIGAYQVQQQNIPPQVPTTTVYRHSAPIPSASQSQVSHNGQLPDLRPPHS